MVRIQRKTVTKKYYSKAVYEYPVYSINIPKKFHKLLQPFLGKDLQADVESVSGGLIIKLFLKPEKPMEKSLLG